MLLLGDFIQLYNILTTCMFEDLTFLYIFLLCCCDLQQAGFNLAIVIIWSMEQKQSPVHQPLKILTPTVPAEVHHQCLPWEKTAPIIPFSISDWMLTSLVLFRFLFEQIHIHVSMWKTIVSQRCVCVCVCVYINSNQLSYFKNLNTRLVI